eukprot:Pgem_evm1s18503
MFKIDPFGVNATPPIPLPQVPLPPLGNLKKYELVNENYTDEVEVGEFEEFRTSFLKNLYDEDSVIP